MVANLGSQKSAEVFVACAEYFEKHKVELPDDERPDEITAGEWKSLGEDEELGEEEDLDGILGGLGEDDEEEFGEEDYLEDPEEEEDGDDPEPPAKKAKTA